MAGRRKSAERRVLRAMDSIPEAALQRWLERGFLTVMPLALAELRRRRLGAKRG